MNSLYNSSNAYKYDNNYYMSQPQRVADYNRQDSITRYNNANAARYNRKAELERSRNQARRKAQKIEKIIAVSVKVALVFVVLSILVYRYVLISELNLTANNLKTEYNELVAENQAIQNEIDSSVDLKKLQEIATTRLGMVRPTSDQIVYIENYKENYGEKVDKNNKTDNEVENTVGEETALSGVPGSIVRYVTGK